MTTSRRKKVGKYRAHTTHGGGSRKKRRGAGSRGGRGMAGGGKRAGHKKAGRPVVFGKKGFVPRSTSVIIKAINVGYFTQDRIKKLLSAGKIKQDGDVYLVDFQNLGYQKCPFHTFPALKIPDRYFLPWHLF